MHQTSYQKEKKRGFGCRQHAWQQRNQKEALEERTVTYLLAIHFLRKGLNYF